jgi:hypothetical protein
LRRRAGYGTAQVDLGLPQRRLAAYACERDVAIVDLLPALRNSREPAFRRHETRLSDAGQRIAAETIGGWIDRQYGASITAVHLASHTQPAR